MKRTILALAALTALTVGCDKVSSTGGPAQSSQADGDHAYIEVNSVSFATEVLQSDQPVLVDFWAPWCGPCVALGPTIAELAVDYQGRVKVAKLNVDDSPEIAQTYGINGIPALLLFKDGKLVDQVVGGRPKSDLVKWIDESL